MSRLTVVLVLALAATAANAQDAKPEQSQTPGATGADGSRPFLFDARMPGDGARQRPLAGDRRRDAGAIVMPPKASQPGNER